MSKPSRKQILFIVGAGASVSYGFPSGEELISRIGSLLSPASRGPATGWGSTTESRIFRALAELDQQYKISGKIAQHHQAHFDAATKIWRGLPIEGSIDCFVQSHSQDEPLVNVAKLAITESILTAERSAQVLAQVSNSYVDGGAPSLDLWSVRDAEDSWYGSLWQLIKGTATLSELRERFKCISFIIFNYDRCVEHFLHDALRSYYGITSFTEVKAIFDELEIYHPYGQVGFLPWQVRYGEPSVPFGADLSYQGLLDVSQSIRTYSEGTDPNASDINRIRECCFTHDKIVSLGFGFLKENLDLLMPKAIGNPPGKAIDLYATAYGKSEDDVRRIEVDLRRRLTFDRVEFHLKNLKCRALFAAHHHGLNS